MQGGHLVFCSLFAEVFPEYLIGLNFSDVWQGAYLKFYFELKSMTIKVYQWF